MVNKIHDIVLYRPSGKNQRNCWHCKHLNWTYAKYSTRKIGHEKAIGEIRCRVYSQWSKNGIVTSEYCLDMFKRNPKEFLRSFVTVDKTWIHYYISEMKKQLKQYTSFGEPASKKTKIGRKDHDHRFLGFEESSSPTVWRSKGQSRDSTMLIYWANSTLDW